MLDKKIAIGVGALLVLSSMILFPTNFFNEVNAIDTNLGTTLYVGGIGPNNYTHIQDAIDNASNGDTVFVYDDSSPYCENVVVDKSINLIGENRDTTIIDGGGTGDVVYISADWVSITGFTTQNSGNSWDDAGNDADGDGIGDIPYSIPGGSNQDSYPLMEPWGVTNQPPTCSLSANPISGYAPLDVTFSMSASDSDGSISLWELDINNDGSAEYSGSGSPSSTRQHTYQNVGTHTAKLTVVDNDGATDTATKTITVSQEPNQQPTADFTYSPAEPTDLETITFTDSSSDTDGNIASYEWDFGDGNTSNDQNPIHKYADDGTYTVTLTVEDDDGATNTKSRDITVRNVKPTANFTYTPESPVKLDATIEFTDDSIDSDGSIVNWSWDFGDGMTGYGSQTTHTYNKTGSYDVILIVTDDDGDTDSYTMTIKVEKEELTPAFEFAFLIIAIASVILFKRRNKRN